MPRRKVVIYLDASVLLIIIGYRTDEYHRRLCNKILADYHIKIPQVVLGEALAVLLREMRKGMDAWPYIETVRRMIRKMHLAPDAFPPVTNEVIRVAHELIELSDVINNMDALILAHAIVDNDAVALYTTDRWMRNSLVRKFIEECVLDKKRDRLLDIPDLFSKHHR